MELYALESKLPDGQPKLRPLYFCSAAGGEYTTKILSCTFILLYSSSFKRLILLLDVKDVHSGHTETLDNANKCDSDIEDEDISEPAEDVNKNKLTQVKRLAIAEISHLEGVYTAFFSLRESSSTSSGTLSFGAWKT